MLGGVLGELKQRNVFRVAGLYAVTGWAVFQVVNAIFPALTLPSWTVTLAAVLLLLGLPITLIIAWAFERTPEGIRRTQPVGAADRPKLGVFDWFLVAMALGVLAISVYQFTATRPAAPEQGRALSSAPDKSIAVLPFVSMSGGADAGYFADGLTEELINSLAQLPDLKVAGRTSAFYFKGRNVDLRAVGRQLGVAHVLEGSVRRSGSRLRITAQLIKAADGFHIWSATYDRTLDDTFAIQTEISNAVAEVLKTKLLRPAASPVIRSAEATRLELEAKARLRTIRLEDLQVARRLYGRLTRMEPGNPDAWAGLAEATMHLAQDHLAIPFDAAEEESVSAINRALRLDPDSANVLRAKGFVYRVLAIRTGNTQYHETALNALARAAEIAPRNPDVLAYYGAQLLTAGRPEEALQKLSVALERDPLNRAANTMMGVALEDLDRPAEAERQYLRTAELFPDYSPALITLAQLRIARGSLDEAVPPLLRARAVDEDALAALLLAHVYVNLGMREELDETLGSITQPPPAVGIAEAIRLQTAGDRNGFLTFAERQLTESGDPIWRDLAGAAAMLAGDMPRARQHLEIAYPGLFQPEPKADASGDVMVVAAAVLERSGEPEQARKILQLAAATEGSTAGEMVTTRVLAFAGLGEGERALAELERAVAAGFRTPVDFELFLPIGDYPQMAGLRGDPRFKAAMARIGEDNARMRARLRAKN